MGRANSSEVTSRACTSSTEPNPSAAAWKPNPAPPARLPTHHVLSRSSRVNNSIGPSCSSVTSCAERC